MYVCICNGITDKQIRAAVAEGATSLEQLEARLGVASSIRKALKRGLHVPDNRRARRKRGARWVTNHN